jgi:hypothetical protein
MRRILSERSLVVVLFIAVLITYALAQEDTRKMEKAFTGLNSSNSSVFVSLVGKMPYDNPAPVKSIR